MKLNSSHKRDFRIRIPSRNVKRACFKPKYISGNENNIPKLVRAGSQFSQLHPLFKSASWCSLLIVLVYFIRGTVLPWYLHLPESLLIGTNLLSLLLATGLVLASGGAWRGAWIFVLMVFAAGITQAEQINTSGSRWCGLALLMFAVGPVISNPVAVALRAAAWKLTVRGLVVLTGIFFVWYVLRLPSFGGRVYFTSFMNQSMLLGPIAGLGAVIGLAHAIHLRSWKWGLFAFIGLIPLLASGSRLAALSTGAAGCFLITKYKPIAGVLCGLLFMTSVAGFIKYAKNDSLGESATGSLVTKGTENSRADLWRCRIEEFKSSPIFGIGIAMGTGAGTAEEKDGSIRVEPGSSYLAILAMTGVLGAMFFISALGILLFKYVIPLRGATLDRDILSAVGIFLAMHAIGEGWVLGFGSPLCFLFWIWLGSLGDAASQPYRAGKKNYTRELLKYGPFKCSLSAN